MEENPFHARKWLVLGWVALLPVLVLVFFPAFQGPFLLDDASGILNNSEFRAVNWHNFLQLFRGHMDVRAYDRHPVAGFTALIDWQLNGADPFGYHLTNLFLHWLVAGALLLLYWNWRGERDRQALFIAFGVVGLWSVHPFATMPVAYITGRQESLMVLFYALALALYLGGRPWLAFLSAVASFLSKEVAVTLPFALLAIDCLQLRVNPIVALWRKRTYYGPLGVVWALICWYLVRGNRKGHILSTDMPLAGPLPYLKAQFGVVVNYYWQMIWPAKLQFYPYVPAPKTVWEWALPLALILLYVAGALLVARRNRWAALALLMPLLVLSPTSSAVPLPFEPAMEYRMYLPLFFLVALYVTVVARRVRPVALAVVLVALPAVALAVRSHLRTRDYATAIRLHEKQLEVDPRSLTALEALAGDYNAREMRDRAEWAAGKLLDYSLEQGAKDFSARALLILGTIREAQRRWPEAIDYFERSMAISRSVNVRCHMASVYLTLGEYGKGEALLKEALGEVPDHPDALLYMYKSRALQKDYAGAEMYLDRVEREHPENEVLPEQRRTLEALKRAAAKEAR